MLKQMLATTNVRRFIGSLTLSFFVSIGFGQVTISPTTTIAAEEGTTIGIATGGSIVSNSFDFSKTKLSTELTGAAQTITGNIYFENLSLTNNGVKTLNGSITITNILSFQRGILTPTSIGKILFTGTEDGIHDANNDSFYNGIFYSSGTGKRLFPVGIVGSQNTYAPLTLSNITEEQTEFGVQVINGSALLTPDTAELSSVNNDRYWKIEGDLSALDSRVGLGLNGLDQYIKDTDGGTTVVEANDIGNEAKNLGSNNTSGSDFAVSSEKISSPILAVGKEKKFSVKINDLITPYTQDGENDKLSIKNLNRFEQNTVTLLDRYGVRIKQWVNFDNETVSFDFSTLSPGNYICIVEYGNTGESTHVTQQMVTVLKTN